MLDSLQVNITNLLVIPDKFCNFLDSVLVKEVREFLKRHRLLLLVKGSNQNRLLNLDNFLLQVLGLGNNTALRLLELVDSFRTLLNVLRDRKTEPVVVLSPFPHL